MKKHIQALSCMVILLVSLNCTAAFAQQKTITGTVFDETKQALPSVSVKVKNTSFITATDVQGKFSISIPDANAVLVFTFIGYQPQEIPVAGKSSITINMSSTSSKLNEVVVVGYGTQKKSDLTGAITQVKTSDINATATANIGEALQGRAAGVSVTTSSSPGSSPRIRVRGANSITAGNDPLLVVDGFPMENGNLNDFNSDDIASLEILKDASATAIYGSRGANGVIILTTKKGAAGKNTINFSSYYGIQNPSRLVKLVSRDEFIDFINAAYTNQTGRPVFSTTVAAPNYDTDWQRALLKGSSPIQNYTLSINGGTEKTKYLLSAGVFSQDGLLQQSGYDRYSLRSNLDQKVTNWLTVGTHLQVNHSNRKYSDDPLSNVFRYGFPTMPVKNPNGSWYYAIDDPLFASYVEGRWNPVADGSQIVDNTSGFRSFGDVYAELKFAKHLSFRTNFGADIANNKEYYFAPSTSTAGWNSKGSGRQSFFNEAQYINENILTYDNSWNKHHLTATGVVSYYTHTQDSLRLSGKSFPSDITGYNNVSSATIQDIPYSLKVSNQLMSYTGRASYSYDSRYLLTVTGRFDGSSRFGVNNKWGFFPSVGLGWNVTNEKFMQPVSAIVSNLKIRGSVGLTGNQAIGNYRSLSLLSLPVYYIHNSNDLLLGLLEGLGNPDLKWEKTLQIDGGFDLSLWNNVVTASFDYYKKNTSDLLYQVPIPTTSGFKSMLQNIGEVQNQGIELALSFNVINSKSFKWSFGGNLAKNNNKIVSLYGNVQSVLISDDQGVARYLKVGEPLNSIYTRKSAGIIQNTDQLAAAKKEQPKNSLLYLGSEKYVDVNGDGTITSADYVNIGTTDPKFYYGLNTTFSYKRFNLDVYGQGATGIASTSTDYNVIGDYQIQNRAYIPSEYAYENMWSPSNPTGTFPRAGAKEVYFSNKSNGNRHYFVIKNIRLGYTINPSLLKKLAIQNLNIYTTAQNYFTFTNFRGYNPETGSVANPYAKTILFGLNANF